jgi:hypothetical protein
MSMTPQSTPRGQNATEEMADLQNIYFDTSVWGHLTDALDRESLIDLLKRKRQIPRASVISVAQILLTPDLEKRDFLCETVRALHGERQVLERPLDIAKVAASAFLHGERTLCIKESGPARSFYDALSDPRNAPVHQVKQWVDNMDFNLQKFIQAVKPPFKDNITNYLSPKVLGRDDFVRALCKFSAAQDLDLSPDQMRGLCHFSDVWRALGATLAYIIHLSASHAPKKRKMHGQGIKRPDGADIWQIVYLGCVQVFVTGDRWMLQAATRVSRLLKHPRCTIYSFDFLKALREFTSGKTSNRRICSVCGISRRQSRGGHAIVR